MKLHAEEIENLLLLCWSEKTSSKWIRRNPWAGQCGVTSLVIQDFFGGEIKRTQIRDKWHFYNMIAGNRLDFTKHQFEEEIAYKDITCSREEAFSDTCSSQYMTLRDCFELELYKRIAAGTISCK